MQISQIAALLCMVTFYGAYFTKMHLQRNKGIQTDQIGKGKKQPKVMQVERLMKLATALVVPVELVSILLKTTAQSLPLCWIGIGLAGSGVVVFILAMATMRDSWRAGIPETDKTDLITTGIYRFSRNPAFLGFDLLYFGLLLAFFNLVHLAFALFAMGMLHLQILQEETFLANAFGRCYLDYKKQTGRYLGRRLDK